MLQVNFIKNNKEEVIKRLAVKNFKHPELIDELIIWDDKRKEYERKEQELFTKIHLVSKEIGDLMAQNKIQEAEAKKNEVKELKSVIIPGGLEAQNKVKEILYLIPNLPHTSVPKGKTPEENEVVREGGQKPLLDKEALPHWELAKKYDLINFELGNKVTGSGFPFYKNKGAKLQRALIQYFLDYNTTEGYTEYQPPLMVNEASAYGTGQLPDKEGQMYFVNDDKYYLIPTAEVPLTNLWRDMLLKEKELPVKMTAYTPCFR